MGSTRSQSEVTGRQYILLTCGSGHPRELINEIFWRCAFRGNFSVFVFKALGGSERDQWNERLSDLVTRALPVNQQNAEAVSLAGSAVAAGVVDMKPADPIEGVLISQIVAAAH
jgi:hypothetical protein